METSFAACLAFTQAEEGGYVTDRRDSGNWTGGRVGQGSLIGSNMGVSAPALTAWMGPSVRVTAEQMRKLPVSTARAIARSKYWTPLGCETVSSGIDLMLFDFGWNRGIATSLNVLVRCLGMDRHWTEPLTPVTIDNVLCQMPPEAMLQQVSIDGVRIMQRLLGIVEDGMAGPETLKAFRAQPDLRAVAIILALSKAQVASCRLLTNFPLYGGGWLARSARRQAAAISAAQQVVSHDKASRESLPLDHAVGSTS